MNTIKEQIAVMQQALDEIILTMKTRPYTESTMGNIHKYKQTMKKITKAIADADDIYGPDQAAAVIYLDAERRSINVEPYHTGIKPPVDVLMHDMNKHCTRVIKYLMDIYSRSEAVELYAADEDDNGDELPGCLEDPVTGQKYNAFEDWMLAKPNTRDETEAWVKMLDNIIE